LKLTRRLRPKHDVPVAAMSDIAFLLIVFFMLTTQIMKEAGKEYVLPKVKDPKELPEATISVLIDDEGKLYLNGDDIVLGNLKPELMGLLEGRPDSERLVHVKCDRGIRARLFQPVITVISEMGAEVELATDKAPPPDKPPRS
jgi:biopolymer transport protein ExbD